VSGLSPKAIAAAYESACRAELRALKPGNVHVYADGHRMRTSDFEHSAEVSALPLARPGARVGERVLGAIQATAERVGTNTNLGIVLLCAPLAAAAEIGSPLVSGLAEVLARLDRQDAEDVYEAIRLASPAGLGEVPNHDVRRDADIDLRTAMAVAAGHDRIARAYVTGFDDVFGIGLPALEAARLRQLAPDWCTTAIYLAFLARIPDTHIRRKFGPDRAEAVRVEAQDIISAIDLASGPVDTLLQFDADLKQRGLNPGTSADFTVATLFADLLEHAAGSMRTLSVT
jgi:triphosphoribosyl-dephospho-CoA synthase